MDGEGIGAMQGHVIVCGLQGVGLRAVEQFSLSGTPVVVIDDDADPRRWRTLAEWGVPHVQRHAHRGEGFDEAGLDRASAVVCVEVDEIHTLETALRIKEIRPDLPLVVQLANPSVARALERVSGPGSVLDVASLAAPSFVEACLLRPSHAIELAGIEFAVVKLVVEPKPETHETFRAHFGHLAPVAIVPGGDAPMEMCPGRDHPLHAGDRVAVLGTVEELQRMDISTTRPASGPARSVGLARRIRLQVGIALEEGNRALAIVASALFALIVAATIVVHYAFRPDGTAPHLGFLSSLYFTVETVATVGYGDYSFAHQSPWLLLGGIVLIALGVALVSTAFALFTNILVSRRIERSLGRRQVPGMVDHVIVIGLGAVGISVVRRLVAEGESVVVIERDADNRYLSQARALGVPVVIADATQSQTHRMVNIADAKAVAVLTSADLTNIETGLSVRESLGERWDDVPVVLRVFDRELAHMMERSFGFQHVRSTSALAAPWFVGAALGLDVLSTFYVDQQPFLVAGLTVAPNGGLQGLSMQDLSSRTRVIALSRAVDGVLEHPPRRGTVFAAGDTAFLLGPYEELLRVLQRDQTPV
ncbi:MAG: NAD-binding protein [Acidimicrobiales bacterium]